MKIKQKESKQSVLRRKRKEAEMATTKNRQALEISRKAEVEKRRKQHLAKLRQRQQGKALQDQAMKNRLKQMQEAQYQDKESSSSVSEPSPPDSPKGSVISKMTKRSGYSARGDNKSYQFGSGRNKGMDPLLGFVCKFEFDLRGFRLDPRRSQSTVVL